MLPEVIKIESDQAMIPMMVKMKKKLMVGGEYEDSNSAN